MRKFLSLLSLVLFIGSAAMAQNKITGTVKDQNGDPVPFATVNVKGTSVSVAADADAFFPSLQKQAMCYQFRLLVLLKLMLQ